jgi:hypothetical protein
LFALVQAVTVAVSPAAVTLGPSATQQFSASVLGNSNTNVTWSLDQPLGTIDTSGLYTAPASILATQSLVVTAQSVADPTKKTTSNITLKPRGVNYKLGPGGPTSLTYNGIEYNLPIGYVVYEVWSPPAGSENPQQPSTMMSSSVSGSTVTQNFGSDPQHQWQLQVGYSGAGTNTLNIDITVTSHATTDILRPNLYPLAWTFAGGTTGQCSSDLDWFLYGSAYPASIMYQSNNVSMAWWLEPANANIHLQNACRSNTDTQFTINLSTKLVNGPVVYTESLNPGQQKHWTLHVRYGDSSQTVQTLAPEAASNYASAFPFITPLKDRRPIGRLMVTNPNTNRSNCTPQNPRCYNFNAPDPLGDPVGFRNAALTFANNTLNVLNGMANRPQGVIIWDLEGQEFLQTFSYVGDPAHLPQLSPEMDAIADEFIGTFTNAGYKVGLTLRPQKILFGASLPATCHSDTDASLRDVFVLTTATPMYRGYICDAPNQWVQEGKALPAVQTDPNSYQDLFNSLSAKVQYALNRWGATLFYVDSNGWSVDGKIMTPQIWRDLATKFPTVTFFPEHRQYSAYGAVSAYNGDQPLQVWETEPTPTTIWSGLPFTMTVNGGDFGANEPTVIDGLRKGDMLLAESWYQSPGITSTDTLYTAARTLNSQLTVTNQATGNTSTYSTALANPSDPAPPACNPTKFRVVFASSAASIPSSTTFCWSTGSCTQDLTGMTVYQIQRTNFNNDTCSVDAVKTIQ